MGPLELSIAIVAVAVGAAVQAGVGFGMNLVAAPVLAVLDPDLVPGPAIVAALGLTILVSIRERTSIDRSGVGFALIGRVPGTVVGALLIASIPDRGVSVAVAAGVFVAAGLSVAGLRLRPTLGTLLAAGVVSGFSSTVSSIGGPPIAIVYANEPGPVVRGSLALIFVVGGFMSLAALAAVGDFGGEEVVASLVLIPPGILGYLAARPLAAHLDAGRSRAAVLALSMTTALVVLVKELL